MRLGGGPTINLEGTLDDGAFQAGTDGGYSLMGVLEDGLITGDVAGPGAVTGAFAAASSSESSPALAFCGTFSGEDTDAASTEVTGTFSVVLAGGVAAGAVYFWTVDGPAATELDTLSVFFRGASTNSTIAVAQTDPATGHLLTITGSYDATTLSGSLLEADGEVPYLFGDFSGSTCE
jgi:hypothetical protein